MSGNLYQLGKGLNLRIGSTVAVNGPHDHYGVVWKKQDSGYFLIKGIGHQKPIATIEADL